MQPTRLSFAFCFLGAFSCASAGAAPPVAGWSPATKWNVDYQPNKCVAARNYANGKAEAAIGFEARPMKKELTTIVQVAGITRDITYGIKGKARFAGREEALQHVIAAPSKRFGRTLYSFVIHREAVEALGPSGQFGFEVRGVQLLLPLTDMPTVMNAMDECVADLVESWGMSREAQARMASPPAPAKGRTMFDADDYPDSALTFGKIGEVQALVQVRADGSVGECRIANSSGHDDIDMATCHSIRKRARFDPARDHGGKPMDAPFLLPVNWNISG
ncbi:MAG: energy transducer TonB [Sphingomicrobium sp.]